MKETLYMGLIYNNNQIIYYLVKTIPVTQNKIKGIIFCIINCILDNPVLFITAIKN